MEPYLRELETTLGAATERFKEELRGIRSNRPSLELLEGISVPCYEKTLPLKQLGSLSLKPPRDIEITVWDPAIVQAATKAIENAKIGVSITNDGTLIRVSLSSLTDERRAELAKTTKKMAEEARIHIRHRRDEIIKKVKAAEEEKKLSEDEVFTLKEKVQKLVDGSNEKIEILLQAKLKELQE